MKQENKNYKVKMLRKILLALALLIIFVPLVLAQMKVYRTDLKVYKNNSVELGGFEAGESRWVDEDEGSDFLLKLLSENQEKLHEVYFRPSFIILSDPPTLINATFVSLNLPYYKNAKTLKVYYKGEEKLSVNISNYLCNFNGKCEEDENYLSCPSDCSWYEGDDLCTSAEDVFNVSVNYWEDNFCDPDCYNDDDCQKENCNDGIKNQNETSVDSGGVCDIILCGNGEQDENEEGIDCGGVCPDCLRGKWTDEFGNRITNASITNTVWIDVKGATPNTNISIDILEDDLLNDDNIRTFNVTSDSNGRISQNWTITEEDYNKGSDLGEKESEFYFEVTKEGGGLLQTVTDLFGSGDRVVSDYLRVTREEISIKGNRCSDDQRIVRLFRPNNSHGEVWNGSNNYSIDICYNDIFNKTYNGSNPHQCNGQNKVLGLSSNTNGQAEVPGNNNYPVDVCYGNLQCQASNNCSSLDNYEEVISLSSETNGHLELIGQNNYNTKICCRGGGFALNVTVYNSTKDKTIFRKEVVFNLDGEEVTKGKKKGLTGLFQTFKRILFGKEGGKGVFNKWVERRKHKFNSKVEDFEIEFDGLNSDKEKARMDIYKVKNKKEIINLENISDFIIVNESNARFDKVNLTFPNNNYDSVVYCAEWDYENEECINQETKPLSQYSYWENEGYITVQVEKFSGYALGKVETQATGLVSHWRFDAGSGTTAYDSVGNNDGSIKNALWTEGINGSALKFDGDGDFVRINDDPSLDIISKITISAWVKPSNLWKDNITHGSSRVVTKLDNTGKGGCCTGYSFDLFNSSYIKNKARFEIFNQSKNLSNISSDSVINTDKWKHLTVTFNGTTQKIYVNGKLDNEISSSVSGIGENGKRLYIGSWKDVHYFNGTIDEVKIWNKALNQTEVQQEYDKNKPEGKGDLVLGMPLNENQGSTAIDHSNYSNNGTIKGATWVQGINGSALSFDGLDDYVEVSDSSSLQFEGQSVTAGAWVKLADIPQDSKWPMILEKGYNVGGQGRIIFRFDGQNYSDPSNPHLRFRIWNQSNEKNVASQKTSWDIGKWYYVVGTYDTTTGNASLYVNGVLENTTYFGPNFILNTSDGFLGIGTSDSQTGGARDTDMFNGTIDEVEIWNRALNQTEVQQEYEKNKPKDDLVLDMPLDENSGNTAVDHSGYGNNGNVSGATWTEGINGSGLEFDNRSDYVGIQDDNSLDLNEMTISLWFRPKSYPRINTSSNLLVKEETTNCYTEDCRVGPYLFEYYSNGNLTFWVNNGTAPHNIQSQATTDIAEVGKWYHIVGVFNGTNPKIYKNGRLEEVGNFTGGSIIQSNGSLVVGKNMYYLGTSWGNVSLNGTMDEIKIWKKALNQTEIQQEYEKNKPPEKANAYWEKQGQNISKANISDSVNMVYEPPTSLDNESMVFTIYDDDTFSDDFIRNFTVNVSGVRGEKEWVISQEDYEKGADWGESDLELYFRITKKNESTSLLQSLANFFGFGEEEVKSGLLRVSGEFPEYKCSLDSQVIMKLMERQDSPGEIWNQTNYRYEVCYGDIFGEVYTGNNPHTCSGQNKVLGLSNITKARAGIPSKDSQVDVCYGNLNCTSTTGGCSLIGPNYLPIVKMSNRTNASLAYMANETYKINESRYPIKICCRPEPEINLSRPYWASMAGQLIQEADKDDKVQLIWEPGMTLQSVEFKIYSNGQLVTTKNATIEDNKATAIWIAKQGQYMINATSEERSEISGELNVSSQTSNQPPVAIIDKPAIASYSINDTIQFRHASYDVDSQVNVEWDFGDNTTSTSNSPTHSYSEVGEKTVRLTVSDGSKQDTTTRDIWITQSKGGLISNQTGDLPFYLNGSNPIKVNLSKGESVTVSRLINATGLGLYELFTWARLVNNNSIYDESKDINIRIIIPTNEYEIEFEVYDEDGYMEEVEENETEIEEEELEEVSEELGLGRFRKRFNLTAGRRVRISQRTPIGRLEMEDVRPMVRTSQVTTQYIRGNDYTGSQPTGKEVESLIAANYSSEELDTGEFTVTLPKNDEVTEICKCEDWDYSAGECSSGGGRGGGGRSGGRSTGRSIRSITGRATRGTGRATRDTRDTRDTSSDGWTCNPTSDYTGFTQNSTHYSFTVTDFSAYAGVSTCTENWTCTDWSSCQNGQKTRNCTDQNQCGTENNKPIEERSCEECLDDCSVNEERCINDNEIWEECGSSFDTDVCTEWGNTTHRSQISQEQPEEVAHPEVPGHYFTCTEINSTEARWQLTDADVDINGGLNMSEINDYLERWKNDEISMAEALRATGAWMKQE